MLTTLIVSEALKELQASRQQLEAEHFPLQSNPDRRILTVSNSSKQIPSSTIAQLHALSPKSTRSALADLDQHFSKTPSRLPHDSSELKPLLQGLVSAYVCAPFVAFSTPVTHKGSSSDPTVTYGHTVILRDIRFEEQHFKIHCSDDDVNAVHCNCKAFAFRPPNEAFCKHIIIAIIAAGLEISSIEHVSEDQILTIINSHV